jgi:hypothetical protein
LSKIEELKEKNKDGEGKVATLLVEHSDDKKALKGQVEHLQNQLNEVRDVPWSGRV